MDNLLILLAGKTILCLLLFLVMLFILALIAMSTLVKNSPMADSKDCIQWDQWDKKSRNLYKLSERMLILISVAFTATTVSLLLLLIQKIF